DLKVDLHTPATQGPLMAEEPLGAFLQELVGEGREQESVEDESGEAAVVLAEIGDLGAVEVDVAAGDGLVAAAAAVVDDPRRRLVPDLPAGGLEAPAPVQLLAVHEEALVQQPDL